MGIGVSVGVIVGVIISPLWQQRLIGCVAGALIWTIPIALLNRLPGGMGGGDVKLAPVLGAMVGTVGIQAQSPHWPYLSCWLASLRSGNCDRLSGDEVARAMGPWMIGSALTAAIAWGVVPDWL